MNSTFRTKCLVVSGILGGLVFGANARADIAYYLDGSTVGGVTPVSNVYQQYNFTFVAEYATTDLSITFRNDPNYTGLDTVSVVDSADTTNTNLIQNGGFEGGGYSVSGNNSLLPNNWTSIGQPNLYAAGRLQTNASVGNGPFNSQSGSGNWVDGAVGGFDGISQSFTTTVGDTYTLSFWESTDPTFNGSTVESIVYLNAGIPDGFVTTGTDVPEPASMALLATSLAGLGVIRRRKAA